MAFIEVHAALRFLMACPTLVASQWERSYARRRTTTANSKDNGGSTVAFTAEDRITDVELHSEAADSYLAYAMSVRQHSSIIHGEKLQRTSNAHARIRRGARLTSTADAVSGRCVFSPRDAICR
jgi:hypothetical protein